MLLIPTGLEWGKLRYTIIYDKLRSHHKLTLAFELVVQ